MLTQHPRASGAVGTLRTFHADPFDRALRGSLHAIAHIATLHAVQIIGVGVSKQR